MKTFVSIIALAAFGVVLFDFVRCYVKSTSTGNQRLWDAGRGSATIVVQQFGAMVALLVTGSEKLTDWICGILNAPGADETIKSAIQSALKPTTVGIGLAVFAILTVLARKRTM